VQQNCIQEFDAHQPWTPGPLTNDGHAVCALAYDSSGVTVLTWGNTQKATWAWWDECVDEAYGILPPEAKQSDFAAGLNFAQLKADLAAVANDCALACFRTNLAPAQSAKNPQSDSAASMSAPADS
jgi:hypothetical protein